MSPPIPGPITRKLRHESAPAAGASFSTQTQHGIPPIFALTRIIHLLFLSHPGNHDLAAASGVLLRRRCFTKSVTRASVSPVDWSMSLSLGCTARGSERRKHRIGGSDCRLLNVAPINHHGKGSMKP